MTEAEPSERLDAPGRPTPSVSKRLALRSGNECAYPGCDKALEKAGVTGGSGTVLAVECHIVAKRDDPTVARAPCLLAEEEKERWAHLIEARHGFGNLVLMCREHAYLIDQIEQQFSVEDVVEMKRAHEDAVEARRRADIEAARSTPVGSMPSPQVKSLILDEIGEWQRKSIKVLAEADPSAFHWLQAELEGGDRADCVRNVVRRWPKELAGGKIELLEALAREAEALGLWREAVNVWERRADKASDPKLRADNLVRAAIDAGVAGSTVRRAELLETAQGLDPDSVRLRLEQLDDLRLVPKEQIEYLDALETDEPALVALIASQRALSNLLIPDLPEAKKDVDLALAADSESVAAQVAQINLKVQEARLAVIGDRPFVMTEVTAARDTALTLRRRLLEMKRWEEASRLLMMAADVMGVIRDPAAARQILERAVPEEYEVAPLGAEVLGDAALRMDGAEFALRVTSKAVRTEAIERIRATAEVDLPGPGRGPALERLESLALGGGPESEFAAASRLLACLPPIAAPWHQAVADVLRGGRNEKMAWKLKAMALARTEPEAARVIALEQPSEAWAAELRLRVGRLIRDDQMTRSAASEFYLYGPDASGVLLIGQAFASLGEAEKATTTLLPLVRDLNSPPLVRSEAYDVLMSLLAADDAWAEAFRIWTEWADFATQSCPSAFDRISAWQVRVLHHKRGA